MSEVVNLWVAVPAALGSAVSFGFTGALQHLATTRVAARPALRPGLLVDLAKQPIWLGSLLANLSGTALQLLALDTGPIVLIEPLLVSGLLFAVLIRSMLARRLPSGRVLAGASLCGAGLAVFLLLAKPSGGAAWLTIGAALPLAVGLAVILLLCLYIAARHPGDPRAFALAVGAGVLFGVSAGLAKLTLGVLDAQGILVMLRSWPLYAVLVIGPTGFLLNQNAFQATKNMAPALAIITVTDPLVGIGIGVLWLGEDLQPGPGPVIGQVFALLGLIAGVWLLANDSRPGRSVSAAGPRTGEAATQ
ncbi:MAG TPA: DMT family transporter [Pseudonocardiaceae bacterium]|jgi:drug/metabolite transporter (DMT)-like permease|nr:DMT family transporter [Pseudonocardiaceae bacterium]